jgi:hypothetical protein
MPVPAKPTLGGRVQAFTIRKMLQQDREPAMRLLEHWNMAPRLPCAELPNPERSTLDLKHTFIAVAGGVPIGVASYIMHAGRFAETASLAVSPAWLGSLVGERLQIARLVEMKARNVVRVRTESDRPEVVDWYLRKFGYRIVGTAPKKHAFGRADVDTWTVLELALDAWQRPYASQVAERAGSRG